MGRDVRRGQIWGRKEEVGRCGEGRKHEAGVGKKEAGGRCGEGRKKGAYLGKEGSIMYDAGVRKGKRRKQVVMSFSSIVLRCAVERRQKALCHSY